MMQNWVEPDGVEHVPRELNWSGASVKYTIHKTFTRHAQPNANSYIVLAFLTSLPRQYGQMRRLLDTVHETVLVFPLLCYY